MKTFIVLLSTFLVESAGISKKQNEVWAPLPKNFDQTKPNSIKKSVKEFSNTQKNNRLPLDSIYIFGDSACDTHNYFEFKGKQDPDPKIYWDGRFSNGPMWPDYLEYYYNLKIKNFAYGGAVVTTDNFVNVEGIPDFADQISSYKNNSFPVGTRPLALIQFVGNDLLGKNITATKVAADMELMLQWLVDIGQVRDFLVFLSPIQDYNTWGYSSALTAMVKRFGAKTAEDLVKIHTLDIGAYYADMVAVPPPTADPGKWHPVSDSCYNQKTGSKCNDPWNYFRFDLYHPSTVPNYNSAIAIGKTIQKFWGQ